LSPLRLKGNCVMTAPESAMRANKSRFSGGKTILMKVPVSITTGSLVAYTQDEMKTAYSYVRFSTPQQLFGDSLRRQVEAAEQFCKQNGYNLDRTLTLHDKGISAFRGANIEIGRLGVFL